MFAHRLGLALGEHNINRMLGELTSDQLIDWIAYSNLEPFGEERGDLRSAIIASTIANCNRGKGQRAFKVNDFMPKFNEPKKTWQEMKASFKQFAKQHNQLNKVDNG